MNTSAVNPETKPALSESNDPSNNQSNNPPKKRPLLGYEDLLVFNGLHREFKKFVRDDPKPTFEHLTDKLPGPSIYNMKDGKLMINQSKELSIMQLAFNAMPLKLHPRPITSQQRQQIVSLKYNSVLEPSINQSIKQKEERAAIVGMKRGRRKDHESPSKRIREHD